MDSAALGWTFMVALGATVIVVLLSFFPSLVPPATEARIHEVASVKRRAEGRFALVYSVIWMYSIINRSRHDVLWSEFRYIYFGVVLLWLVGPTLIFAIEVLVFLQVFSSQLIEFLGVATFSEVYGSHTGEFWVPVTLGIPTAVLLILSVLHLGGDLVRIWLVGKQRFSLPYDVGQWPRELVSPFLRLVSWGWLALPWTAVLIVVGIFYTVANSVDS